MGAVQGKMQQRLSSGKWSPVAGPELGSQGVRESERKKPHSSLMEPAKQRDNVRALILTIQGSNLSLVV